MGGGEAERYYLINQQPFIWRVVSGPVLDTRKWWSEMTVEREYLPVIVVIGGG